MIREEGYVRTRISQLVQLPRYKFHNIFASSQVGPYKGRRKGGILAPVEMKPVEIIGALPENGSTKFLTRFQGTDDVKFMSREEAVKLYPQLVIDFYQSKIQWIMDREWMYGAQQAK